MALLINDPDPVRPLLSELSRRGTAVEWIDPKGHTYDPAEPRSPYSLVFNLLSPAAFARDGARGMLFTLGYLANLERLGVPVVNGLSAFTYETSKARQLTLLESLGLPYPRAVVVNHASQAPVVAEALRFPVLVKPNVGRSAAARFNSVDELAQAAAGGELDLGPDETALVQEYVPARGEAAIRLEMLGGRFLYAARLRGSTAEAFTPPDHLVATGELIVRTAGIDVGGVEYRIDDRDGGLVYVDVHAGTMPAVRPDGLGFDPVAKVVDFLERVARAGRVFGPDGARPVVFPDAEYWGPEL
jgi:glutathione synthase/RimK-type ligase-like ATP-grasp enzyme